MNHRYYWSLIALAASFIAEAQGYLESERWKGWVQTATEVYYDEVDRRMLLVDRQLDYVQFRYSPTGGGLKPTLVTRIPLTQLGTATVIGFSSGEVVLDSASANGGLVYRFGLDSSYREVIMTPVFQDSVRVLGSQILDVDRRAVGSSIASRQWKNGGLSLQNQIVLADTLRPDWMSFQSGKWLAIWRPDDEAPVISFLSTSGIWNQFPYPINQDGVVPSQMFIIDNDSLMVLGTKGDSVIFNFMRLRQAPVNTVGDRVKLGDFTLFYETTQALAPSSVNQDLKPGEKLESVVPNQQSVGGERAKKKGRFAVMFDTFKNADDAYSLLNGLVGKFPDAYAVDTKEGIAVMGPNRVSLAQIQADSSRAYSSGIGVKKMVTYADKLKERKETLVTLQVYDSQKKTAVPFTLVFFNRGTDRIIFTDTVRSGRINFIYSHGAELGVAVSSPGYFPQSVRLNPTMAPVATHYYHDMFLKPSVVRDPSNPNRMVVQSADLDFQNVLFDFNSDVPRKISFVEISAMKQAFANIDSVALVIEGHTDDIGSEAFNMDLGRRRASAVAKELRLALRPTASLTAISLGEARPVAENDNDFHRSLNRRVTLRVEGARPVPPVVVQSPEPTEEAVEVEVSNTPASVDSVESPGSIDSAKIAQVEEVVPTEPVMSSPLMPELAKSQARELTKAAKGAERAAKETAKAKAEADKELAKAAKSAAEAALKQRQDSIKAFEDARLRRIMDVAAQRKAADEAKAAEQKAAAAKAKEDAKKGKKSDAPKATPDKPKK